MNRAELERRAQLWQRHRAARAAWFGGAAGFAAACLVVGASPAGAGLLGAAVMVGVFLFLRQRKPPVTAETIAAHLNRLCPTLEESAGLWLREAATLNLVERLQLRRLNAAWELLADRATLGCPYPRALRPAIALCAAAMAALPLANRWPHADAPPSAARSAVVDPVPAPKTPVPFLRAATLGINPPAYLRGPIRRISGLDAEVAEGSLVTWDLEVSSDVAAVSLESAGADGAIRAEALGGGRFRASSTVVDTRVYQVTIAQTGGARVRWPGIHAIKSIRDQPPRLAWQEPAAPRTIVDPANGRPLVAVRLLAADDHGVAGVQLIMTVAKGSGEAVKFREQVATLTRSNAADGSGDRFERTLDLAALGLEPGDELYFHAVASDRRTPSPNRTRSETRFVVLRGPAAQAAAPAVALAGINRVPQYFRSQRQLIIDTERLLAERLSLTEAQFRARSEDIGVDQKLLRLRYGQFLGEEFEPTSSGAPREAQAMALAGTLRSQPRDAVNRAAAVGRAVEAQHVHPPAADREVRPLTVQEIMAPFLHQHDSAEAATLFDTHVKAALRSVLAAMWEAEGQLRTGQPAAALPAENRALELLQALQQADRLYVQRVGHEPAPLEIAERRLRGDLAAIPQETRDALAEPPRNAETAALESALAALTGAVSAGLSAEIAAQVDARLAVAAQDQPEKFVAALESWRRRAAGLPPSERDALRRALWSLLPSAREAPNRPVESSPALAGSYFEALDARAGGNR